jgi:hypothetical protein
MLPVRGSVDTAIWTKPCGDLAGQLLYGDSIQCSNFVPTPTLFMEVYAIQYALCRSESESFVLCANHYAGFAKLFDQILGECARLWR